MCKNGLSLRNVHDIWQTRGWGIFYVCDWKRKHKIANNCLWEVILWMIFALVPRIGCVNFLQKPHLTFIVENKDTIKSHLGVAIKFTCVKCEALVFWGYWNDLGKPDQSARGFGGSADAIHIFPCPGWGLALPTGGRPQWQFTDSSNWLTDHHNVNSTLGTLGTLAKRSSLSPTHLLRREMGRCSAKW